MAGLSLGELRFYDKFNNAYILPTVNSTGDGEGRLEKLKTLDGDIIHAVYDSYPQGNYIGFEDRRSVKILGHYLPDESIAGIGCDIGGGRIALWSPGLEQPLSSSPGSAPLSSPQEANIADLDKERLKILRRTLIYLGLHLPASSATPQDDNEDAPIARPFPQFLVCSPERPDVVDRIVAGLSDAFEPSDDDDAPKVIKDSNDTITFHFSTHSSTQTLLKTSKNLLRTPNEPSTWQQKHIVIHPNGTFPSPAYTHPYFDLSLFFQHLASLRPPTSAPTTPSESIDSWPLGTALFFTPSITSTQTLLDKNPKYLSSLPTPTTHIASYQLLARGRGSNAWLSPAGSLSQSIHLRIPSSACVPSSKLVFVQYLYAMAVCQGVRDDSVLGDDGGGEGWRVRIKWPNDIYALVGPKGGKESEVEKKKIGGVLVSMSFGAGGVDIIIGMSFYTAGQRDYLTVIITRLWVKRIQ
jgi:biotin--protein ligase